MPKKGYKQTPEHIAKIAEANRNRDEKTKKRIAEMMLLANKNRIWTEESRKKMSDSKKGTVISEHQRQLVSIAHKGKKFTEEHKLKISIALKGKTKSPDHVIKMSQYWKGRMVGDKNPNWKGGVPESEFNKRYMVRIAKAEGCHSREEWNALKEEFDFTCPACGRSEPEIKLSKDHIVPLSKGGSNYISNIQPLCKYCNSKKKTKTLVYQKWGERLYA